MTTGQKDNFFYLKQKLIQIFRFKKVTLKIETTAKKIVKLNVLKFKRQSNIEKSLQIKLKNIREQ